MESTSKELEGAVWVTHASWTHTATVCTADLDSHCHILHYWRVGGEPREPPGGSSGMWWEVALRSSINEYNIFGYDVIPKF
jgi:hypothetical protein